MAKKQALQIIVTKISHDNDPDPTLIPLATAGKTSAQLEYEMWGIEMRAMLGGVSNINVNGQDFRWINDAMVEIRRILGEDGPTAA